ncbi:MAG: hypothetical protein ACW98Y_20035 [Candidatus Thorarchaeota archaeon]|jgi:hypothetical protein
MSNYERNNTMVACVLAFIILGAVAVGAVFFLGTTNWTWTPINNNFNWDEGEMFEFERTETSMPAEVTLDVDVLTGGVQIIFVDDADLLYDISIWVPNATLQEHGDPTVTYASETITVDYPTCGVNVTLGSGTTYELDVRTTTGGVSIVLGAPAHVADIGVDVTTGGIDFVMTNDVVIIGNLTFSLSTTTGGISANIALPTDVEGRFTGSVTTGSVDVTAVGWDEVVADVLYETANYGNSSNSITITAGTTTGGVSAVLT